MSISMSSVAHGAIEQMFRGLAGVLEKAEADAKAREIDEAVYLNTRLSPDMFPLIKQVQIATELPARTLARLAGAQVPNIEDTETSFKDLRDRIDAAREIIHSLDNEAIDAEPGGTITFPVGENEMTLPRLSFLQNMILPNLYFHVTMSYAILRYLGVELGKFDYMAVPKS